MLGQVLIITRYTLDYLLHHRLLSFALITFITCFAIAHTMASMLIGSYSKIMLDGVLFSYQLFSFLLVALFSITYFNQQIEYQVCAFFFTKPLSRAQFFWGTFSGFVIALLCAALCFYSVSVLSLYYLTNKWFWHLCTGFVTIAAESIILLSIALFFSLLLSHPLSYLAVFAIYVICYTNAHWYAMAQKQTGLFYAFAVISYYIFPDLSILDIKNNVVHELAIDWQLYIATLLYSFCFSGLFLFGAQHLFIKKILE